MFRGTLGKVLFDIWVTVLESHLPPGPRNVITEEIRTAYLPSTPPSQGVLESSAYLGTLWSDFLFNSLTLGNLVEFLYVSYGGGG